jgi:hypothetical protein
MIIILRLILTLSPIGGEGIKDLQDLRLFSVPKSSWYWWPRRLAWAAAAKACGCQKFFKEGGRDARPTIKFFSKT